MPDATTTLFLVSSDPPPIARTMPFEGTGRLMLVMPGGITLHGEPDLLRAWLQCGLDALSDGSVVARDRSGGPIVTGGPPPVGEITKESVAAMVRWSATEAVVVPEHPSVNHWPAETGSSAPLCGADATLGAPAPAPVTCPDCLRLAGLDILGADAAEVDPDA